MDWASDDDKNTAAEVLVEVLVEVLLEMLLEVLVEVLLEVLLEVLFNRFEEVVDPASLDVLLDNLLLV